MTAAQASLAPSLPTRRRGGLALAALLGLVGLVAVLSLGAGAMRIPPERVLAALAGGFGAGSGDALVVLQIRLPRLLLGLLVGAALAISGALMQGLFRNPLADPALVGVSSGAALAAAAAIVLGDRALAPLIGHLPFAMLPLAAFLGALSATAALYVIATREGHTSTATMLLAGVAFSAFASAGIGFLAYVSDDRQLRDLTFWTLGSLGGSTWTKLAAVAPLVAPVILLVAMLGRGLNALSLGEAEAYHLGVAVQRLKAVVILAVAVAVGAAVAATGMIGFVGIVTPHLLRLVIGPDHRLLLPASALLGAALLCGADILARTAVAPAELPIGVLTAAIGAPFFLWLLLRRGERALS